MKDEHRENRPKLRYFRYAVTSFTTLIVLSLGFSLIPAAPRPADPPFSEQARLSALQDSLDLRSAAERLSATASAGGAANAAAVEETVTLLTLQVRALLSPSDATRTRDASAPGAPPPPGAPIPPTAATATEATVEPTVEGMASALSASGVQRLGDAATADGGIARLLAGAGTAQLLAAERLAAAGGIATAVLPHAGAASPAPGGSAPTAGPSASMCPSPASGPTDAGQATTATGTADGLGEALAAAVTMEQQSIYAYQAALPRLNPEDSRAAATFLGQHEELEAAVAARSTAACSAAQAQQPGFVLDPGFLAAPGDGLRRLELAALPAYGDIIAQADGGLRIWAIGALQSAARRAARLSGAVGPVPGVLLDQDQLPELPASPAPAPAGT